MNILLSEISMPLGTAILYYVVRFIEFSAIAGVGIALGIKLRKRKNNKEKAEQ